MDPIEVDNCQVEEMVKVLEVIEMAVRRIDVDYSLDANAGHLHAWNSIQRKLRYLSSLSKSASWSTEFHEVMKHARMMRKVVLTSETKSAARAHCSNCMVCGSKEDSCAYGVELVCSPCDQEGVPHDALHECTPAELQRNALLLIDEFTLVASEDDLDTVRETTTTPPPGYLGVYATGKTCCWHIEQAMLSKTMIANEILRVENELSKLSATTLHAMRKEPNKFKTATKAHAKLLCKKLHVAETQLASKKKEMVPNCKSVANDEVFDRIDHWLSVNARNMESEGEGNDIDWMLVKASTDRSRGLLGCEDGEDDAWSNVFAFDKLEWKEEPKKREREEDSELGPPRRPFRRSLVVVTDDESGDEGGTEEATDDEVIEVEEEVEEGEIDTGQVVVQLKVFAHREAIRELEEGRAPKAFLSVNQAVEAVTGEADVLKALKVYAHKRAVSELEKRGTTHEFSLLQRAMNAVTVPVPLITSDQNV